MNEHCTAVAAPELGAKAHSADAMRRLSSSALTAFLTVVDLFATQAILPSLARHYGVSPAAMGFAVNASTMGMAVSGLAVALFSRHIDRRHGILLSLLLLAIPTALLAVAPDLTVFTALRVDPGTVHVGGLHLDAGLSRRAMQRQGQRQRLRRLHHGQCGQQPVRASDVRGHRRPSGPGGEFLCLRRCSILPARRWSISVCGARGRWLRPARPPLGPCGLARASAQRTAARQLRHRLLHPLHLHRHLHLCELRPGAPAHRLGPDAAGLRLFRLPALDPDHASGRARGGALRHASHLLGRARASPALGLPLLLLPNLAGVAVGLALVGVGTFFAQAAATGFVSRAAVGDRGSASGIYLACYFLGGLVGQRRSGPGLRPVRLDGLRRRHGDLTRLPPCLPSSSRRQCLRRPPPDQPGARGAGDAFHRASTLPCGFVDLAQRIHRGRPLKLLRGGAELGVLPAPIGGLDRSANAKSGPPVFPGSRRASPHLRPFRFACRNKQEQREARPLPGFFVPCPALSSNLARALTIF